MESSIVEMACRMQEDLDEYRRFCGDLLIALVNREHRMCVRHGLKDGDDMFDAIWDELDKLLREVNDLREKNRVRH